MLRFLHLDRFDHPQRLICSFSALVRVLISPEEAVRCDIILQRVDQASSVIYRSACCGIGNQRDARLSAPPVVPVKTFWLSPFVTAVKVSRLRWPCSA